MAVTGISQSQAGEYPTAFSDLGFKTGSGQQQINGNDV